MNRTESRGDFPSREPSRVASQAPAPVTHGDYRHFVAWIVERTGIEASLVRALLRGLMATGELAIRRDRTMPSGLRVVPLKLTVSSVSRVIPRQTPPLRRGGKP
jgi:hypothetical protein